LFTDIAAPLNFAVELPAVYAAFLQRCAAHCSQDFAAAVSQGYLAAD